MQILRQDGIILPFLMAKYGYLAIGGIVGTLARYLLTGFVHRFARLDFPYGTLAVNLSGCFLIGFLVALSGEKWMLNPNARLLLVTGFFGAYTTFSAFILETSNLLGEGQMTRAALNVLGSVIGGLIIFRAGVLTAELF